MFGSIAQQFLPATPYNPVGKNTGIDGFLYNPQILSSLRQDNIDTAAAVGSPVGMVFDQWVANTVGSNTVTNGDFPTATTGWTSGASSLSIVSATLRVTNSGAAVGRAYQSQTTVVGTTYKCTVDLVTNADGALIAVGTTTSNSNLFSLAIAATTTGSYTFYFIATTTTSFIQLRTNVATNAKFTEWDNVTCKSVGGRNLIQQNSASRPTLRQASNGTYYLECLGTNTFLINSSNYDVMLPHYVACVASVVSASVNIFGASLGGANLHALKRSGTAPRGDLRCPDGSHTPTGVSNTYPLDRVAVIDSLGLVGAVDITINRRTPVSTANTWSGSSVATGCWPGINNSGSTTSGGEIKFYGGVAMRADPGADRAGIRAWLANLALAD